MQVLTKFHGSDIALYTSCRRKFWFSYVDRLTPETVNATDDDALTYGSIMHRSLYSLFRGEDWLSPIAELPIANGMHGAVSAEHTMRAYIKEYEATFHLWDTLQMEQPLEYRFKVPGLPDDYEFTYIFTLDRGAINRKTGSWWMIDYKNYSRYPKLEVLELDPQFTGYLWAAKKLDLPYRGVKLIVLLKKNLRKPDVLKNGTISKAQRTLEATTYDLYLEAIEENELDVANYEYELDLLKNSSPPIFQEYTLTRTDAELETYEEELFEKIREICNPNTKFYSSPGYGCNFCKYVPLCKASNEQSARHWEYARGLYRLKTEDER